MPLIQPSGAPEVGGELVRCVFDRASVCFRLAGISGTLPAKIARARTAFGIRFAGGLAHRDSYPL
jgi:hypothetical protein